MIPSLTWNEFQEWWHWKQGEHVTLLGPTGRGKTTLALEILPRRSFVIVLANKRKDVTLERFAKRSGFRVVDEWPAGLGERFILWPRLYDRADIAKQQEYFAKALDSAFREGAWTIYADEILYVTEYLKLKQHLNLLWQQGRSLHVSIVGGTQRPRNIPMYAYDQATHLFIWRDNDEQNVKRILEFVGGNVDPHLVRKALQALTIHETLYVNTRDGTVARTMAEPTSR